MSWPNEMPAPLRRARVRPLSSTSDMMSSGPSVVFSKSAVR